VPDEINYKEFLLMITDYIISAFVSFLAFRERISGKEWISVVGAFVATVLFAF
jgi:drug/metabolite transporter (DMT)-like permease